MLGKADATLITADGSYQWDGRTFTSLSAVAFAVTGAKWNGKLFFNVVGRKSKA